MVLVSKSKTTPVPIFYRGADYNLQYDDNIEYALKNCKIVHFSCWPISQKNSRKTIEKRVYQMKREEKSELIILRLVERKMNGILSI